MRIRLDRQGLPVSGRENRYISKQTQSEKAVIICGLAGAIQLVIVAVVGSTGFYAMAKPQIIVNDRMQSGYVYTLSEPVAKNFHADFRPELTPGEMLELGVFGGKYMTDCQDEFPRDWFSNAKLSPSGADPELNLFGVTASQPLSEWRKKGWIWEDDPRGWYQWYCRYYVGRRCVDDDRQVKRWKAMTRHIAQIRKNCECYEFDCRPKQRQALLHWAYDPRNI